MRDARARLIVAGIPPPGETVRLPAHEAAHARARRLEAGDPVVLIDGSGRSASAEVVQLTRAAALVRVHAIVEAAPAAPPLSLFVAGIRAERLSWVVEKATELGAARVTVVESDRTQRFRADRARIPRLDRVAREAAKQCERDDWPHIEGPVPLERVLESETASERFLLDPGAELFPSRVSRSSAALLVGPEGGWTESETRSAAARGWRVASLPAGKLRAETAAIAALVLLRFTMVSR